MTPVRRSSVRHSSALCPAVAAVAAAAALWVTVPQAAAAPAVGPSDSQDIAAWRRTGRPDRLMVLRPGAVDLVRNGSVVHRLYPQLGSVPMSWLAANAGQEWVSHSAGDLKSVRLRSAVLLTPGTELKIGPVTKKVLLSAGASAASGTWIRASHATVSISGATVGSIGPHGSEPAAAGTAGRPYILMGSGGRLDISDTTITGLGRPGTAQPGTSGVTWGKDSTGSAVDSSFLGNRTGLRLAGSTGVRLSKVTVKDSTGDGVVLTHDTGTTVHGLTSQSNGRNGVTVGGTAHRTLDGISTQGNHGNGIMATAQTGLRLTGFTAHADRGDGIRLVSCAACTVSDAAVDGAPGALAVSGAGSRVTVTNPAFSDGTTGIALAAGIDGATVSGGTVRGFDRGIAIAGSSVTVSGTDVGDSRTGISVYGPARRVALRGLTVSGSRVGVTASGTTGAVSLTDVKVDDASRKGLSSASPGLRATGLRVTGGTVSGATTAVDLGASATLDTLTVSGARRGMHVAAGVHVTGTALDILAERKGIEIDRGGSLDLRDSRVRAPIALSGAGSVRRLGDTEVTLPPFPWLGFAALLALTLAIGLQTVHQVRHRRTPIPRVAGHVRNIA